MQKEEKIKSKTDAWFTLFTIVVYQEHISLPEGPGRCVILITDYTIILIILAFVFPTIIFCSLIYIAIIVGPSRNTAPSAHFVRSGWQSG